MNDEHPRSGAQPGEESALSASAGLPAPAAHHEAPNAENVASGRAFKSPPSPWPPPPEPPIRTESTPLSKLPRCIVCKEFVGSTFKVIDFHLGVVNPRGAQHVAGLMLAHRFPIGIAEIFSAEPDPVNVTADPRVDSRAYYCMECFALSDLPKVEELIHRREEEAR